MTLIGATTENPSFEVNSALVSRCRVYVLNALTDDQIGQVLDQALQDKERGLARSVELADQAKAAIVNLSNGDARSSLNMLELCASVAEANDTKEIDLETVKSVVQRRSIVYDKSGEMHYDLISALHKSIAEVIQTQAYIGSRECSPEAKIRCFWRGGWSEWPPKISAWPIPRHYIRP